jgi:aryl-alcohol dehydrogenase-like predicted oxidoreductase
LKDSRLANPFYFRFNAPGLEEKVSKTDQLIAIASEIGCSLAQLAIAWCTSNDKVSTVILGASRISQLDENLDALEFVEKITPEIRARIDAIIEPKFTIPKPDQYLITRRNEWL